MPKPGSTLMMTLINQFQDAAHALEKVADYLEIDWWYSEVSDISRRVSEEIDDRLKERKEQERAKEE